MFSARSPIIQKFLFLIIVLLLLFSTDNLLFAQTNPMIEGAATLGVARLIEVKDKDVKDGSIISSYEQGPSLSNRAYDPQVIGVVARDAGIIFTTSNVENGVPVIAQGTVYVLVSSKEGVIKKGDLLTTSTIPGVAVKAVKDGYVLGRALEDYNNTNAEQVDKIAAEFNLHYFNAKPTLAGQLSDIFKIALLPTKDGPTPVFKYLAAAAVVIAAFVLAFLSFGRTAAKGVEALGRNPAASKIIHLGIIFNVSIVIVIVLAGLTVAFLILRL